jgi:hypothetical protein
MVFMLEQAIPTYVIEHDELQTRFTSAAEMCAHLDRLAEHDNFDVWVLLDVGRRRGWLWRLLGYNAQVLTPCFHLEKAGEFAALTFLDDAWSEYRAVDPDRGVEAPVEVRLKLSGGEPNPASPEICFSAEKALAAAKHFLLEGKKPNWLTYQFVR